MHDAMTSTHWHEPTAGGRAGKKTFGRPKTPYDIFMEEEGVPIFRGLGFRRVHDLPLGDWKRLGGRGSYIQLYGTEGKWGCYVIEVPGRGALNAEKHMFEKIYYVVEGRGSVEVWMEGDSKKHIFEYQKGSMFAIPMNAMHRVVNATSTPGLLIAGTTAPNIMNLIGNKGAIFENNFAFTDRFSTADDYYKYKEDIEPDPVRGLAMRRSNFLPDVLNCDLPLDNRRSPGSKRLEPYMTANTFYLWLAEHRTGHYSKAHAHSSAAVILCLQGQGYTITWPESASIKPWEAGKGDLVQRVDYEYSGMVSAAPGGARWNHQHFGVSKGPLRISAWFGPNNPAREPGPPGEKHTDYTGMDIPEGGTAIPYWMEDPFVKQEYDRSIKANGGESHMQAAYYDKDYKGELPKE
jgi:mannose-6-phosphate isomerase-like protein (cupin superfamily)